MIRTLGIAAVLALALAMPAQEAAAQDTLGGAILGGVGGAIVGGALGGGRGAAIGAVVGAGTGAAIASEGERRRNGYYYYRNSCYFQGRDGGHDPRLRNGCATSSEPNLNQESKRGQGDSSDKLHWLPPKGVLACPSTLVLCGGFGSAPALTGSRLFWTTPSKNDFH